MGTTGKHFLTPHRAGMNLFLTVLHRRKILHYYSCSESPTASQPKVACNAEHGPRKHRYPEQLYLPSFHPRRRL